MSETDYDIELIEWRDSYGCSPSWESIKDIQPSPVVCFSTGFVIHEDGEVLVICPHIHPGTKHSEPQGCGEMTIPKVAIVDRSKIKRRERQEGKA